MAKQIGLILLLGILVPFLALTTTYGKDGVAISC
jgi:hypothetical protein